MWLMKGLEPWVCQEAAVLFPFRKVSHGGNRWVTGRRVGGVAAPSCTQLGVALRT